jgi:DNA replication protein DnaC
MSTATDPSARGLYEQLKDDLGYLKLTRATEVLPSLLDRARDQQLTHAQFLAELVAEEAAATRNRRMAARLRFAHSPPGAPWPSSTSTSNPRSTPSSSTTSPRCGSWPKAARSCC